MEDSILYRHCSVMKGRSNPTIMEVLVVIVTAAIMGQACMQMYIVCV